jgi:hypothetical protein
MQLQYIINWIIKEIESWLEWTGFSLVWDIQMEIKTGDAFEHSKVCITITK